MFGVASLSVVGVDYIFLKILTQLKSVKSIKRLLISIFLILYLKNKHFILIYIIKRPETCIIF
jgi:hypothetical protein